MRDLGTDSQPIDPLTLVNKLKDRKELDAVGGAGYVSGLMDGLPDRPLESVRHYVGEVRRFAGLRRIAQAAE
ncbi:MAG: replicative DNA helicase, partial [Acidobacteria bacterium]